MERARAILEVLGVALETPDHEIIKANDCREAIEILDQGAPIDLVISDLCMPDVSGRELYAHVQERHPNLAKRVLFLTGDTLSPDARSFLEESGNRWFSKPFNIRDLQEVVEQYLHPEPIRELLDSANKVSSR